MFACYIFKCKGWNLKGFWRNFQLFTYEPLSTKMFHFYLCETSRGDAALTLPGWASWSRCRSQTGEGWWCPSCSSVLTGGGAVGCEGRPSWSQSATTPQSNPRRGGTSGPNRNRTAPERRVLNKDTHYLSKTNKGFLSSVLVTHSSAEFVLSLTVCWNVFKWFILCNNVEMKVNRLLIHHYTL